MDPNFVLPYVALARINSTSVNRTEPWRTTESNAFAGRALQLDPNQAQAYVVLARNALLFGKEMNNGKNYLDHALQLIPNNYDALSLLVRFHLATGQPQMALKEAELAMTLEPMISKSFYFLSLAQIYNHQFKAAIETLDHALAQH